MIGTTATSMENSFIAVSTSLSDMENNMMIICEKTSEENRKISIILIADVHKNLLSFNVRICTD